MRASGVKIFLQMQAAADLQNAVFLSAHDFGVLRQAAVVGGASGTKDMLLCVLDDP